MVQTVAATAVSIKTLKEQFGLAIAPDPDFFSEWRSPYPDLSELERTTLDRVKANFLTLQEEPPLLEDAVKMVVLAPLLDLAGFYQPPFRLQTETSIDITTEDNGLTIRGRIDILVLKNRLWFLTIESKRSDFSVTRAIPQALSYLLANPTPPSFGLIANGNEFLFLKTAPNNPAGNYYANSPLFSLLNPDNDLYAVLQVFKKLSLLVD